MKEKPKFERLEDKRLPEEKEKEEKRLGLAFSKAAEGDFEFAKELGVEFFEGTEESNENEIKRRVEKGSEKELFFQTLAQEYPEFGISIGEISRQEASEEEKSVYVYINIKGHNSEKIRTLLNDVALNVLMVDNFKEEDYNYALKHKVLPEDTLKRLRVKTKLKQGVINKEKLEEMEVDLISDDELRDLMLENINRVLAEK